MSLHDIPNIHGVPLLLNQQGITQALASHLGMYVSKSGPNIQKWSDIVHAIENPTASVTIAVCGKYTEGTDTYLSVIRALQHAAASLKLKLDIAWVDSEQLEDAKQGSVECVRQRDTAVLQWLQTLLTLFACTKRIGISFALAMAFSCPEALVPVESMV
jgi:CTP synthase (UTP-ammonia lyase)